MQYNIGVELTAEGKKSMRLDVIIKIKNEKRTYRIDKPAGEWRPINFGTATTNMKDWIGNVRALKEMPENDEVFCVVEGVYDGKMRKIPNVKLRETIKMIGERVMVTEHINVAGGFDMLATKKRILDSGNPDLNWINIGWSNDQQSQYLRVDPYTGEVRKCVGEAIK